MKDEDEKKNDEIREKVREKVIEICKSSGDDFKPDKFFELLDGGYIIYLEPSEIDTKNYVIFLLKLLDQASDGVLLYY